MSVSQRNVFSDISRAWADLKSSGQSSSLSWQVVFDVGYLDVLTVGIITAHL